MKISQLFWYFWRFRSAFSQSGTIVERTLRAVSLAVTRFKTQYL